MTTEIVVTLRMDEFCRDFELPANAILGEVYPRLLTVLQETSNRLFGDWEGVLLETEEGVLLDLTATLNDYGICDGCYLNIIREE